MPVWASAAAAPPSQPRQSRNARGEQGLISHVASCKWLSIGKGVTELRTRQDVLLPMLPAQEILPDSLHCQKVAARSKKATSTRAMCSCCACWATFSTTIWRTKGIGIRPTRCTTSSVHGTVVPGDKAHR